MSELDLIFDSQKQLKANLKKSFQSIFINILFR